VHGLTCVFVSNRCEGPQFWTTGEFWFCPIIGGPTRSRQSVAKLLRPISLGRALPEDRADAEVGDRAAATNPRLTNRPRGRIGRL